jgi:two-component system, OmpR family, phosphate regulon sensor histidine kinase PhoR
MSLRLRLVLAFGYVLLFAIVALEVPLTLNFSRRVDSEIKAEASAGAQAVAAAASGRLTNATALADLAREQARRLGGRVIVVDSRGRVLVDSDGAAARGTPYSSRPEIGQALNGATSQGTRHSDSLDADLLYTAVPIVDAGRAAGAVRLTQSVDAVHDEVRRDVVALLALGAAVLALGLGLAWAIAGSLSRPLRGLARTARQIAAGDLRTRPRRRARPSRSRWPTPSTT